MTKESIWSSAAYARVGVATNQASAVTIIKKNATTTRGTRPPSCQARSPAARNCTISSLSPMPGRQSSISLTPRFTGCNGLALVIDPFTSRQRDFHLRVPIGEVQRQRHQSGARVLQLALDLGDLTLGQQQLAGTPRAVVGPGPVAVLRDMSPSQKDLAVVDSGVGVGEVGTPLPQRLHLGAAEDDARLIGVVDVVVVPSLAVLCDKPAASVLRHAPILPRLR